VIVYTVGMLALAAVIVYVRYRRGSFVDFKPPSADPPPTLDGFDGPDEAGS
jgi:hypothetical protein